MEIDLVYLWVDGNDPAWLAKKNSFLPADRQMPVQAVGNCRYVQSDELRYSLRSAEMYAPWLRRIYIVTDGQTPEWLDTSNPRVRVVSHSQFIPSELLPVFNSCTIELFLSRIPELSEHFLYANDDTFFNAPVTPGFFFDAAGRPIVRVKRQSLRRHPEDIYCCQLMRMQELVRARYGRCTTLAPHHNIDAYRRSDWEVCDREFHAEMFRSCGRFRSGDDWQRMLVSYHMLAVGRAVMRKVSRHNRSTGLWQRLLTVFGKGCCSDSRCIPAYVPNPDAVLRKYRPVLFCLNDDVRMTDEDRRRVREFLEGHFPKKSSFEK